jgi:small subunit ribosomal protein S2
VTTSELSPNVTVRDLLDAGLHFGHQTKRWNPKMKRYIFDKRNGIHIIDLTKSLALLKDALQFLQNVSASGRPILLVGTKKQAQESIRVAAQECKQHSVTIRWLGGALTNITTIRRSIKRLRELESLRGNEDFAGLPKKEAARLRNELGKLHKNLCGITEMAEIPGAMFVVDINRESIAVAEAKFAAVIGCVWR